MTTKTATWGAETQTNRAATLSGVFASMKRAWSRRRTNTLLADLNDETLHDIGLDPSQVRRSHRDLTDWVVQTQSGTARIVFIGR